MEPTPPTSDPDRRALAAVAAQFFVNGAMTSSYIARAPQLRDRIGVTVDELGLLLTLGALAGIVTSLLAGRIVDAASTRRVLRVAAVVMVAGLPLIGMARGPWSFLAAVALYMALDVLVDIAMNLQGSWISGRRRVPVMNRLHGLWSVGLLVGGAGAAVANRVGLSTATHLLVVAVLMAGVLAVVARNLLDDDAVGHGGDVTATAPVTGGSRRTAVALLALAGAFAVAMEMTGGEWAAFRLADDLDATPAAASLAFVAYAAGMSAMRVGGDVLQLRLGREGLHRLAMAVSSVGFLLASLVDRRGVVLLGFLLVGLGVATLMPKLYDDAARVPGRRGAGLGAMTAGMRVGVLVTPAAVGGLAGTDLTVGAAIAIVTLPAALGLVVVTALGTRPAATGGA